MKVVMLMFDSLNRKALPSYGCSWAKLPNFERLQKRVLTFDNFYAGGLPCMPARRELHTGKYNFLHRSWGPLEPFDDSCIERLKAAGVYTHLVSDHSHYWEDGGATYHNRYNSWQQSRGQEGDHWMGQVAEPEIPEAVSPHPGPLWRQDWVNRKFLSDEEKMPQTQTLNNGIDFIARNHNADRWFLQIETFDPHEPYYVPEEYVRLYPDSYAGEHLDWPNYGLNAYTSEQTEHLNKLYASLVAFCDKSLGRVLDAFDKFDLWDDTMLIVNTDHGFMLGEKDWMGKNTQPCYNEIVHTPFFVWDPRTAHANERRSALVQTVDIPLTLLSFFGVDAPDATDGRDLTPVIEDDTPVREGALFGTFGTHVNVTDGKAVLMRAPVSQTNGPLYNYTLMPMHMDSMFSLPELRNPQISREPFAPVPVLKYKADSYINAYWYGDLLFDLEQDPDQEHPITDKEDLKLRLINLMCTLMRQNKAPAEQYERLGLPREGKVNGDWLSGPGRRVPFCAPEELDDMPLTQEAKKAVCILLSIMLIIPDGQQYWNSLLTGLADIAGEQMLDEEQTLAAIDQMLTVAGGKDAAMVKMILQFVRGFMRYQQ